MPPGGHLAANRDGDGPSGQHRQASRQRDIGIAVPDRGRLADLPAIMAQMR